MEGDDDEGLFPNSAFRELWQEFHATMQSVLPAVPESAPSDRPLSYDDVEPVLATLQYPIRLRDIKAELRRLYPCRSHGGLSRMIRRTHVLTHTRDITVMTMDMHRNEEVLRLRNAAIAHEAGAYSTAMAYAAKKSIFRDVEQSICVYRENPETLLEVAREEYVRCVSHVSPARRG